MKALFKQLLIGVAGLTIVATSAFGQDYPNKAVRILVGVPPGGGADAAARFLGQLLLQAFGQPFIVENRSSAGGTLAAALVAKAPSDGYALLLGSTGQLAITPNLVKELPYDTLKDFTPVSLIFTNSPVLVSNVKTQIRTIQDLVRAAKDAPGKIGYGSAGVGGIHHLAMEAFKSGVGVDILHIPYKGGGQSVPAILAGEVPLLMISPVSVIAHVRAGKLNILAVATTARIPELPDVPSISEFIKGYDFPTQTGLLGPAGLQPEVVAKLSKAIKTAFDDPAIRKKFQATEFGNSLNWTTPAEYTRIIRYNLNKYKDVVRLANIQPE